MICCECCVLPPVCIVYSWLFWLGIHSYVHYAPFTACSVYSLLSALSISSCVHFVVPSVYIVYSLLRVLFVYSCIYLFWFVSALWIASCVYCLIFAVCAVYVFLCLLYNLFCVYSILPPVCNVYSFLCALFFSSYVNCILFSLHDYEYFGCPNYISAFLQLMSKYGDLRLITETWVLMGRKNIYVDFSNVTIAKHILFKRNMLGLPYRGISLATLKILQVSDYFEETVFLTTLEKLYSESPQKGLIFTHLIKAWFT